MEFELAYFEAESNTFAITPQEFSPPREANL